MYRHHNFEERLNIVSRLQSGESLDSLCKDLKIDKKMVRLWYLRYKKYGEDGLRGIRYSHYTADEKFVIVKKFVENNHGKTKSATLQKRNMIFKAKTKCTKITEKATHLSGFFHLFKRSLNNIQKEQYIV